jgi:hypothetical protein
MVSIDFITRASIKDNQAAYSDIDVDLTKVLESWQQAVFAHHWINSDGKVKDIVEQSDKNQERRKSIEEAINKGEPIEKPILGIGIYDNIEVGSGTAELCIAALNNIKTLPVHIRTTNLDDFKPFLASSP